MRGLRHIIKYLVCWCLLLQLVNLSVNLPHINTLERSGDHRTSEPSFSEIETLYELVAESFYHQEVPDTDDDDIDNTSKTLDFFFVTRPANKLADISTFIEHHTRYNKASHAVHKEPHSPPPRQV